MSGTHVFYNGVLLRDCETKSFKQDVILDESRNLVTNRFRIRVESLVYGFRTASEEESLTHPSTVTLQRPEGSTSQTAIDRMHLIQNKLNQPRGDFFYATNHGRRVDATSDNIYQILVAATGQPTGTVESPEFFKDINGDDITIRFKDDYHISGGDTGKLPRVNLLDTNNGPTPIDVTLTDVLAGQSYRISFEIEVHTHLCLNQEAEEIKPEGIDEDETVDPNPYIISNSWSSEETLDDSWLRTRSITGTLRVRDQRYWAQGFRYLCLPALLPGYRRVSQKFASDPTNLVLKYRVEDRQAEAAPPWPCVEWSMTHIDSARNEYGLIHRQLRISLTGAPKARKETLIAVALNVLNARFTGATALEDIRETRPISFFREALIITQSSDKPIVELLCDLKLNLAGIGGFERAAEASASSLPALLGGVAYDPDNWPAPRPYDAESPAGVFACYLQSPCNQWHGIPRYQRLDLGDYRNDLTSEQEENSLPSYDPPEVPIEYWKESDYAAYQVTVPFPASMLQADANRATHRTYPYVHVEIDTRYEHNVGQMVLPLSKPRTPSSSFPTITETVAVIPIHAGVQRRVVTVIASRNGFPPELPEPAKVLKDYNGITEKLVGTAKIVIDAPEASADQTHRVYRVQGKFEYALSRPIDGAAGEIYRIANNPMLVTTPQDNFLSGLALFSRGAIEMHSADGTSPSYRDQGYNPINPGQVVNPGVIPNLTPPA